MYYITKAIVLNLRSNLGEVYLTVTLHCLSPCSHQEIFCTSVNCNCKSFRPGRLRRRQCEICGHGWVAHALSKLRAQPTHHDGQVEVVHCSAAFDICSLMLFGTQAIPVRLKILLDRLFSVLKQEEVIQILTALEWTLQDYVRGYILQDPSGKVVDRWVMMTFEEEIATLQQFLRFGETKPIVELMTIQDKEDQAIAVSAACSESVIQAFMENSPPSCPDFTTNARNWTTGAEHHFVDSFKNGASMLPFQFLSYLSTPLLDCTPGKAFPMAETSDGVECIVEEGCDKCAGSRDKSSLTPGAWI
uniref:Zinc finger protein basonuclin-2-like n=1 Tax=Scleropages formosus TaxID=113540 RepID=A0A8C9RYM8_SCLFO